MAGIIGFNNSRSIPMAHIEGNVMNSPRRWFGLDLDLNYPLPGEAMASYTLYSIASSRNVQAGRTQQQETAAEGVEVIDNDIAIISPDMFDEARKKPRIDSDAVREHTMASQPMNEPQFTESSKNVQPPPPPPLEEPIFRCPVCLDELKEATSTKCGHIFCKECIESAIAAQKKCPTCRKKFRGKSTLFRVYLPSVI